MTIGMLIAEDWLENCTGYTDQKEVLARMIDRVLEGKEASSEAAIKELKEIREVK